MTETDYRTIRAQIAAEHGVPASEVGDRAVQLRYETEGNAPMNMDRLDVIERKRYILIAERLSEVVGDRTARVFKDKQTGEWYPAESWKRPNKRYRLRPEQVAYMERVLTANGS